LYNESTILSIEIFKNVKKLKNRMLKQNLPLDFRLLRPAVLAAICARAVFAVVFLAGFAVPMAAARISAFTGLIGLFRHNCSSF